MIVKWNNNIVDYKGKVVFDFFRYKSILFFFMLVYVLKKKREHATYDIRDSYYKPVAPAFCWCNPPAPSYRASLEPGFPVRDAGALTRNAKGYSLNRLNTTFYFWWFSLSSLRFLPPGVGLTGSSRPSKVLLEFKALILKTEHKQTLQSVVMLDCIERILIDREDISHLG